MTFIQQLLHGKNPRDTLAFSFCPVFSLGKPCMESLVAFVKQFIHVILHLDLYLNTWITDFGPWIYLLLFLIIFAETGLVVAPFLPGDSLLFALGALCAVDNAFLDLNILMVLLIVAAILGDAVNYAIGKYFGPRIFSRDTGRLLNKAHLLKAHAFYERHGGKAIIIARFAPIIRTFAPFVAGIARMSYPRFLAYNVVGGVVWVALFLFAGFYFGNLPQVKTNFHVVILAIIVLSLLPVVFEYAKAWRAKRSDVA
jgi:membrane-associated protein